MARLTPNSDLASPAGRHASERGFTLAGLIVIMTVMAIIVAYTVPRQWSMVMARERDRQTIFAMKQYARSIREFQRKNNVLPSGLKQLKDARTPRFMRGLTGFINDPVSGEPDWILLPVGTPPGNQIQGAGGTGIPLQQPTPGSGPGGATGATGTTGSTQSTGGLSRTPGAAGEQQLVGGFVGVRPSRTGPSFIKFNDKETYEEWTYTIDDLRIETEARQQALMKK